MKVPGLVAILCLWAFSASARQGNDGYILRLDEATQSSSVDVETLVAVSQSLRPPVLWVRRDGRRYEIRDRAILDRVAEALRPVRKISEEHQAFEQRARPLYRQESDLDRQIDAIEDGKRPDEGRLAKLEAERRELRPQLRDVEAEESDLDARQERAEAVFERALGALVDEALRTGLARRVD